MLFWFWMSVAVGLYVLQWAAARAETAVRRTEPNLAQPATRAHDEPPSLDQIVAAIRKARPCGRPETGD